MTITILVKSLFSVFNPLRSPVGLPLYKHPRYILRENYRSAFSLSHLLQSHSVSFHSRREGAPKSSCGV